MVATATDDAGYFTDAGEDDPLRDAERKPHRRRIRSVTDAADAVEFFVGDLSRWISGQRLLVSGGALS